MKTAGWLYRVLRLYREIRSMSFSQARDRIRAAIKRGCL